MATTEPSTSGYPRSSKMPVSPVLSGSLTCIWGAALLATLLWGPAAIAATPTDTELQDAITKLTGCINVDEERRPVCGNSALQSILSDDVRQKAAARAGCVKVISGSPGYRVSSVKTCITWLQSLQGATTKAAEPVTTIPVNTPGLLGADASPAPSRKAEADLAAPASGIPASTPSTIAIVAATDKTPVNPEGSAKADSGAQPMLLWLASGISVLLLAGLVIGYLKSSAAFAALEEQVEDRDRELAKLAKENQQLQEALVLARREVSAAMPILKRDLPPDVCPAAAEGPAVAEAAPPLASMPTDSSDIAPVGTNISEAAVQVPDIASPKPEDQAPTSEAIQEAILGAIASLANGRASLTEANFVHKVAGVTTNATLKAVLLANLEPALFFLCSGARSPQGPELVVYRLKGSPNHSVVPYPSAGRVGQFNRWFENAGSPYGVSPVLAIKAAVGVIGADGNLSASSLGVLA